MTHEMMPDAREFLRARGPRSDLHPPVELHRIRGNNLRVEALGQVNRQRSLAGCRRPYHGQHLRHCRLRKLCSI